jgi:hypothetical protein
MKTLYALIFAIIFEQTAWAQSRDYCQRSYFGYRSDRVIFSLSQNDEQVVLRPDINLDQSHSFPFEYQKEIFAGKEPLIGLRPLFNFRNTRSDLLFTRDGDRVFIDVSSSPNGVREVLTIDLFDGNSQIVKLASELRPNRGRIGTAVSPNRVGDYWIFNLKYGFNSPHYQQEALSVLIDVESDDFASGVIDQPFTTRGLVDLHDDDRVDLQLVSTDLRSSYAYMEGTQYADTWTESDAAGVFQVDDDHIWEDGIVAVEMTYQMRHPKVRGRTPYQITQFISADPEGFKYRHADGPKYRSFQYDGANKDFIWLEKITDPDGGTTIIESTDASLAKLLNVYKSEGWQFFTVHERNSETREYIIRLSAHPIHEVWELKLDEFGRLTAENLLCVSGRS